MYWNAFQTRLRDWSRRIVPFVQIVLSRSIRFVKSSRWLPGVLISLLAALIIAFSVGWYALGPILDRPAWWMIAAVVFFYFNAIACRALVLRVLLQEKVGFSQSLINLNEGLLINILLPLRLGDSGRALFLAHKLSESVFYIRSAIRVERLYDAFIAIGLIVASVIISTGTSWVRSISYLVLGLLFILLLSLPRLAEYKDQFSAFVKRVLESFPSVGQPILVKVFSIFEGLTNISNLNVFNLSIFWSGMGWVFRFAGLFTLIKGVSPYAPLGFGIFVAGMLVLSHLLPSAPGEVGVYEGAIILALFLLGVDPTTALACALFSHLIDIILPLILGGVGLLQEGESLPGLYNKLSNLN